MEKEQTEQIKNTEKKFVVIGSNSFSGASFIGYLLDRGYEVVGISRSPEAEPVFLPYKKKRQQAFAFYQLDLNRDLDRIIEVIREFAPHYLVNFAAQGMVAESWQNPEHWFQTNVLAHIKLHERLRQSDFLGKYVNISTPEVYGNCTGNVKEDAPYNPSTPYAVSKAACDMSLQTFYKNYQFPVVFTRAVNIYGPGQQLYRIIPRTIMSIKSGRKLPLQGGGTSVRSFLHARDMADATLRVALHAPPGEIYHVSTDRYLAIRDVVELICKIMGVSFEEAVEIVGERPGKDAAYYVDSTKIRENLGWQDQIAMEDGISETVEWVNDNYSELENCPLEYIHKP